MADTGITKQGYLDKQSKYLKQFRRSWMVLKGDYLYSYSEKDRKETEIIDLKMFKEIKKSKKSKVNGFELISKNRTRLFIAQCEEDMNEWIDNIQNVLNNNENKSIYIIMYAQLINMGFDENICMKAAQKYPNDLNQAIDYIAKCEKVNDNDTDIYIISLTFYSDIIPILFHSIPVLFRCYTAFISLLFRYYTAYDILFRYYIDIIPCYIDIIACYIGIVVILYRF